MTVAATIEIVPLASPWHLFVKWYGLSIWIDGLRSRMSWRTHEFVVAPGDHVVRVGLGLTGFEGRAQANVTVNLSETVRLTYRPPFIKLLPGKLEIERVPTVRVVLRDKDRT